MRIHVISTDKMGSTGVNKRAASSKNEANMSPASTDNPKEPSMGEMMTLLKSINKTVSSSDAKLSDYIQANDTKVNDVIDKANANSDRISELERQMAALVQNHGANKNIRNEGVSNGTFSDEKSKQSSLRNNICIQGISQRENENLDDIVQAVCTVLKISLQRNEYSTAYRTKGSAKSPGFIIVRLTDFSKKMEILKAKRSIQRLSSAQLRVEGLSDSIIYVNNHVTPFFGKMLASGRKAVQSKQLHSIWLAKECIRAMKTATSDHILVANMSELDTLINSAPSSKRRAGNDDQRDEAHELAKTKKKKITTGTTSTQSTSNKRLVVKLTK